MNSLPPIGASSTKSLCTAGRLLPQEILAEIAECFSERCYREHLLALSLASRSLRIEAQRVLFRDLDRASAKDHPVTSKESTTHRLFLQAVIGSPTRLALYVRRFTSRFLAFVPAHLDEYEEQCLIVSDHYSWAVGCELWNLTSRGLPLLTQLKHLTLFLSTDWKYTRKDSEPSPFRGTSFLRRCSFTLDSFSWSERHGLQNAISDLEEFLARQPNLQWLNINTTHRNLWYTDKIPHLQLFSDALPCLRRLLAPSRFLPGLLSESRPIDTLFWLESWSCDAAMLTDEVKQTLQRVKCLALFDVNGLEIISPNLSSVETLYLKRVPASWHKDMSTLTHLKSLHTLILDVSVPHIGSLNVTHPDHNTPETNPALRIATKAFEICADTLQNVHFPLRGFNLYRLLTVDRKGQFQMQKLRDLSDIVQLFAPWIPREEPLWADVEDYL